MCVITFFLKFKISQHQDFLSILLPLTKHTHTHPLLPHRIPAVWRSTRMEKRAVGVVDRETFNFYYISVLFAFLTMFMWHFRLKSLFWTLNKMKRQKDFTHTYTHTELCNERGRREGQAKYLKVAMSFVLLFGKKAKFLLSFRLFSLAKGWGKGKERQICICSWLAVSVRNYPLQ